jgi:hypothetical protein
MIHILFYCFLALASLFIPNQLAGMNDLWYLVEAIKQNQEKSEQQSLKRNYPSDSDGIAKFKPPKKKARLKVFFEYEIFSSQENEISYVCEFIKTNATSLKNSYGETARDLWQQLKKDIVWLQKTIERNGDLKEFISNSCSWENKTNLFHKVSCFIYAPPGLAVKTMIRNIKEIGIDINQKDTSDGKTPLHYALEAKNFLYASYFIPEGANPLITDHAGNNSLHYFFKALQVEDMPVRINYRNNQFLVVLSSCQQGELEQLLLAKNNRQETPLDYLKNCSNLRKKSIKRFFIWDCGISNNFFEVSPK